MELISAQALQFLAGFCKTRSYIQMKISRTTKPDRAAPKAYANYLNASPNELPCFKEASISAFFKKDVKRSRKSRRFWI